MKFAISGVLALTAAMIMTPALAERPKAAKEGKAKAASVERGRYIVSTSGCIDCHSPWKMTENGPAPDPLRYLSGHPESLQMPPAPALPPGPWGMVAASTNTAWSGEWGVSYTANLTPDPETGLGKWTVDDFKATLRTGRRMGRGRAILPPMPIHVYSQWTEQDMENVFAYLRTIPPIKNRVPEPRPPVMNAVPK